MTNRLLAAAVLLSSFSVSASAQRLTNGHFTRGAEIVSDHDVYQ